MNADSRKVTEHGAGNIGRHVSLPGAGITLAIAFSTHAGF